MSMFVSVVLEHGEIPESVCGGPGVEKTFANQFENLDSLARQLGLTPLGDFYVDYAEQLERIVTDDELEIEELEGALGRLGADGPWFDPEEGLRTIRGLIQHVESTPTGRADVDAGRLEVLRSIAGELEYARQHGYRFHLAFHE